MKRERSAGAIIYRKEKDSVEFLLLCYGEGHWDFAKGHVEKGETDKQAMLREVKEETGLRELCVVPFFSDEITYFYKRTRELIHKTVVIFLVETESDNVKLSFEHKDYVWLPYNEAVEKLTFNSARKALKKAGSFLKANEQR